MPELKKNSALPLLLVCILLCADDCDKYRFYADLKLLPIFLMEVVGAKANGTSKMVNEY